MSKLPGYRVYPPGLERKVLRRLPPVLLAGVLLPAWFAGAVMLFLPARMDVVYASAGLVFTHLMIVLTVGIYCVIVAAMKGPAWVADAYELPDSARPRS